MKKNFYLIIIFLAFKTVILSQTCTAVPVITLSPAGVPGIATHVMVAYNPINNVYYWNTGGFGSNPIATHASTGGSTLNVATGNQDWRGLWWNSNTNTLEGNCYNSAGIFTVAINLGNGYATGGSAIVSSNQQPNPQVGGQYDPISNQVLYYNGAFGIAKYNRATGLLASTTAITGLPGGIGSIATYGFYTGIAGMEYAIYDYTYKRAYYINYSTGAYVSTVQFPASAGAPSAYSLSYANGLFFIYDNTNWVGFRAGIWANHNAPVCTGGSATIQAQGSPSYSWSNGPSSNSIVVTPTINTSYTVSGTPGVGCLSDFVVTININPGLNPTVAISGNTLICGTGTNVLIANGANTYSWSSGATTSTLSVSPAVTTIYTVVGTNSINCTHTQTITVNVSPNPTVSITGSISICEGQSTTLTANGANSYSWSNGTLNSNVSLTPTITTSYSVVGTTTQGCSGTNVQTVTVKPSPTLSIAGSTSVCEGGTINLSVSGADTYSWNTGSLSNSITASPTINTTYSVTGTYTSNGCPANAMQLVIVNVNPTITIAGNNTICPGQTVTLNAGGANTYTWNTGATSASISVSPTVNTTYSVIGTSSAGCTSSTTVEMFTTTCTGINTISSHKNIADVYPNPTTGFLTIYLNAFSEETNISIYNVLGILINHKNVTSKKTIIDLQDEANGIYFVKVSENNKISFLSKIVKQ